MTLYSRELHSYRPSARYVKYEKWRVMLHLTQLNGFDTKIHWEKYTSEIFTAKIVVYIPYAALFILHFHWKLCRQTHLCWPIEDSWGEARSWKDRMGKTIGSSKGHVDGPTNLLQSAPGHVSIWPTLSTTWEMKNCRLMKELNCFWSVSLKKVLHIAISLDSLAPDHSYRRLLLRGKTGNSINKNNFKQEKKNDHEMKEVLKKHTQKNLLFIIRFFSSPSANLQHLLACTEELWAGQRSRIIVRVGTHRVTKVPMKCFVLQPAVSWHKLAIILASALLYHKLNFEAHETTQQDEITES